MFTCGRKQEKQSMKSLSTTCKARADKAGLTVIEVVIALAILGVTLGGAYAVLLISIQNRAFAHDHYAATLLANNRLEHARHLAFSEVGDEFEEDAVRIDDEGVHDPEGRFFRSTSVTPNYRDDHRLKEVEVRIQVPLPRHRDRAAGTITMSAVLIDHQTEGNGD